MWPTTAALFAIIVLCPIVGHADPPSSTRRGPAQFGRVFERHRSTLVRVKPRTDQNRWVSGFLIGARGEIVFGLERAPTERLAVRGPDGEEHAARLLGFDRGLRLAVGRLVTPWDGAAPLASVAADDVPAVDDWVLILGHDAKGRPTPHAGVVAGRAARGEDGDARMPVLVPGAPGRPIVDRQGRLVGISVARGRRRTQMVTIASVQPFLRRVVLGGR